MTVAVDPYLIDWLDFLLRWLHVIAGIVWIGTSFYFVALDNHLHPPARPEDVEAGIAGEAWEVHGGGFYLVQKLKVAPKTLPEPLYWFKWEAYTTWLSGFALMCVLYYVDADVNLVQSSLGETWGIVLSIALLAIAWLVYDTLCRVLRNELVLAAVLIALTTVTAYGLSLVYTDRAVWLQLGAMLGTIMVANVFFVVIPGPLGADPGEGGGSRARPGGRDPRQAALGPQQLPHAPRADRDARRPLRSRLRQRGRLARPRLPDGDRRLDPPLLQPAPRRSDALVDAGRRRGGARRHRDLDPPA